MLILVWFVVCIIFAFVQLILGSSGHALEVFAVLTAIALFIIHKLKDKIRIQKWKRITQGTMLHITVKVQKAKTKARPNKHKCDPHP